ncbi:hypothetical protein [Mycobacterium sp. 852002-51057_SCH5723018]|uniref:hypothetical protein n=1 Tax=Mycobacterium sp. 852002-51057_SCH5723018 TaxID=1834094 RepID=UPI0007FE8A64|nr:hypothetical protein [Mycobacterium sp. 852002-51057_SCH5723018]OBG29911.1 hypothetical protein A5764_20495 [Mycobacterium sp. 852002-51057_SCH5723018]
METLVGKFLDAIPPQHRAVIVEELAHRDAGLLAEVGEVQEPTATQLQAVEHVLATAVIKSLGSDYTPNEHGLAVERAIESLLEVWPISR